MSANALALRQGRLREILEGIGRVSELVNLSELMGALSAYQFAANLTRTSDLTDEAQLAAVTEAWITFLRELADVTKSEGDDQLAETIAQFKGQLAWLVAFIATYLKAKAETRATAAVAPAELAALAIDVETAWFWISVILDLIERFRKK